MAASLVVASTAATFKAFFGAQAMVVGQQKLRYFYDLVGYSWLDRVDTFVEAPAGTLWIEASGTTLQINVNGTTYLESYGFQVRSQNITAPGCLELRPSADGVTILVAEEVNCAWQPS